MTTRIGKVGDASMVGCSVMTGVLPTFWLSRKMNNPHTSIVADASMGNTPGDDHLENPAMPYASHNAAALNKISTATNTVSPPCFTLRKKYVYNAFQGRMIPKVSGFTFAAPVSCKTQEVTCCHFLRNAAASSPLRSMTMLPLFSINVLYCSL